MKRRMRFLEVTVPIGLDCTYRYKRLSEESSFRAIDRGSRTGRARVVLWDGFAAWDLQRGRADYNFTFNPPAYGEWIPDRRRARPGITEKITSTSARNRDAKVDEGQSFHGSQCRRDRGAHQYMARSNRCGCDHQDRHGRDGRTRKGRRWKPSVHRRDGLVRAAVELGRAMQIAPPRRSPERLSTIVWAGR